MNRRLFKVGIVMVLFALLLYYGVAWALVSCFHDPDHSDHELAAYEDPSRSDHDYANLECVGPAYHTESMAESSSASRSQRLAPVHDLTLGTATRDDAGDRGLREVLEKFSSLFLPIGTPRYLSLRALRI